MNTAPSIIMAVERVGEAAFGEEGNLVDVAMLKGSANGLGTGACFAFEVIISGNSIRLIDQGGTKLIQWVEYRILNSFAC
jgi:hypothetical protein